MPQRFQFHQAMKHTHDIGVFERITPISLHTRDSAGHRLHHLNAIYATLLPTRDLQARRLPPDVTGCADQSLLVEHFDLGRSVHRDHPCL